MDKIIIEQCPLCGKQHLRPAINCKDYSISQEDFDIYVCDDCGFMFTQGFPDETVIAPYYESNVYISHSNTHKGLLNKLYHLARRIMLRRKADLVKRLTAIKKGALLDYGAGTGYFAHTMQEGGWQVQSIEKSEGARRFALENFKLRLMDESALDSLPAKSFDVITLWHVMEHVQNINALWKKLHDLLKDNGILLIAVPNHTSADAKHYASYWAAYDVPRHLWHFSPSTIRQFGLKHGFVLEKQEGMPLDAFYVSVLSEKYKHAWFPLTKGFIRGCACRIASLSRKSASSSIIYVFRKQSL